jgi:YidC/Oxa1 family membrane protein insertase
LIDALSQFFMTLLNAIQSVVGSYAVAILFFTVIIKLVLYPATQKQYRSMKEMQALQPKIKQLQERYKDNQQKLQEEQMKLFTEHGVNPFGGCLPLFIQMPILYGIYATIYHFKPVFESEHVPFLWIGGWMSQQYPHYFARNLSQPDMALLIMYGISMYLSQKLTVTDPSTAQQQASMNLFMPIFITWVLHTFPSALVLYWLTFNLLGLIQQAHIIRMPPPTLKKVAAGPILMERLAQSAPKGSAPPDAK